jgi:AAA15 family ATPase/GTPase
MKPEQIVKFVQAFFYFCGFNEIIMIMENQPPLAEKIHLELDKLLLTPNTDYWAKNEVQYIGDEKILQKSFQNDLLNTIADANIDLINNIIKNGFIEDKEKIYVVEVEESYFYKVIEGNKQIAALKMLKQRLEKGENIGKLNIDVFNQIAVFENPKKIKEYALSTFSDFMKTLSGEHENKTFKLLFSDEAKSLEKNIKNHFQNIKIKNYKGFKDDLKVGEFRRINIIAGDNNVGKTSFLEAVYLLANLNNTKGVFSICQTRGKLTNGINGETLERLMPNQIKISGTFDNKDYQVELSNYNSKKSDLDRANYRTSYELKANDLKTDINVFNTKQPEIFYEEQAQICLTVFSSPFSFLDKQLLEKYHDNAVEKGIFFEIINFINIHIDDNFLSINKVGKGSFVRFIVNHKKLGAVDLTEFGDGVQRIFYVAIMMASAENGVICIDEIENAIHYKLLVKFTKFIQTLAEKLNIQVFATTHSNECIKAFFENDYKNEEIAGFRLINTDNKISYATASGEEFQTLLENFSLDLRG